MSKMNNEDIAIRVHNIKKDFYLPHEKSSKSLKSIIVNTFKKKDKGADIQHVLRGLSFDIKKGEFFGIVGRNGSGKSTLLKILAQIYQPTGGKVEHFGKLVPFIELGVGFNPELSGRENVYLNGALLGFTREEIAEKYDKIVEFAELEDFMDQKLKNYSSGMQVRLAFSVAIQADADILVLDEVLAVGDEAFQRKCFQYFAHLKREKKTVILVTHSMDSVQNFCTKAMLIDGGKIFKYGNTAEVSREYIKLNNIDSEDSSANNAAESIEEREYTSKYLNAEIDMNRQKGKVYIKIDIEPKLSMEDPVVALLLADETGKQIYRWTTDNKDGFSLTPNERRTVNVILQDIFPVGEITANLRVLKKDRTVNYADLFNLASLSIKNDSIDRWDVHWHPDEEYNFSKRSP